MSEKEKPLEDEGLAAVSTKGSGSSENLPKRVERYSKAHTQCLEMVAYLENDHKHLGLDDAVQVGRLIERMSSCGNFLTFRHYFTVDEVRLHKANFCMKHLLCPLCAIRRGAKQVESYLSRFEEIRKEKPHLKPYLLTLTIKNGNDLEERFEHLFKSVRKYLDRRRDSLKKGRGFCEFSKIEGGVFSYEVTRPDLTWHPHTHMIVLIDPSNPVDFDLKNPKKSALSREWHDITGDSFIVDLRPLNSDDPAEGFVEVFKYALKFSDLEPADNYHAFRVLKGKRLVSSFGDFWGVKVPEKLTDEPLEDLPYIELFYRYMNGLYNLCSHSRHE